MAAEVSRSGAGSPGKIRIAGLVRESIVDGPGLRFVVFCQGCPHSCPGCHNAATHDFSGGYDCEIEKILSAIEKDPLLDGVTFSGGEPMCQPEGFYELAREIRRRFPQMNIVTFTGYTYEELEMLAAENPDLQGLLDLTDLLIDGPFVEAQKDLTLRFRGSRNQRIFDMNATRQQKKPVLAEEYL